MWLPTNPVAPVISARADTGYPMWETIGRNEQIYQDEDTYSFLIFYRLLINPVSLIELCSAGFDGTIHGLVVLQYP